MMELPVEYMRELPIDQLLGESAAEKLEKTMDTISTVQRSLFALAESEDSYQFDLHPPVSLSAFLKGFPG